MLVEYTLNFKTLETHFIVVAMATYIPLRFLWKMKIFQMNPFFPFFFKLFLKQKLIFFIRNVHKMFYTYYHGCHGNIFFPKFLWKWKFFKSSPFFLLSFLKQEWKKKSYTHIIMVAMETYFFLKFLQKMKKVKPIFLLLFLKQELKKIIRNVQNKFYTHYHGCYGNIFFSKVFVKN